MSLRILIVEDDKHVRRILESLLLNDPTLKSRDPEVISAADGEQGLKALDSGPYDLVITDLLMPRMDGFQFCRELRKHRLGAHVHLIITSAIYKDTGTQLRLRKEVGEHQFFAKPYEIRDLIQAVNRMLDGDKREEPAPAGALSEVAESGSLADRSPPRLLLDLAERKVSGTLLVQRGKIKKEIGFQNGVLIHCDSNLRTETLGHFLVSRGVIDEKQHQAALTRTQAKKEMFGQSLVELGWITEKDLLHQLAAQMRAKVASTLRWRDGEWSFTPGPVAARLRTPIDVALLVFLGLQKTAHIDDIAQLLAGVRGRLSLSTRAARHRETFARVFGVAVLDALARQPLIEDLMAGTDPAAMLVQLDALLNCSLAELQSVESVDEPEEPPQTSPDPVALHLISQPAPAPPPVAQQKNLYDELFGDEPSMVHSLSRMVVAPSPPPPSAPDTEELRKEILTEYLNLSGRNFYEILGVSPSATPEALAEAYARIRDRFRLERFAEVDLGSDYAHLEKLHQAILRAWETLSHQRAEYDRGLAQMQQQVQPIHSAIDAELLAREAEALLFAGEAERARDKLEQAVAAAPDVAHHHAHLGWANFLADGGADAADPQAALAAAWRHLEQALAIDPDDRDAHELAGRVAAAVGDDDRAILHLERALDAQPDRTEALTVLEAIYARNGAYKPLERRYRKLISRVGDHPLRIELWARLGELYLEHLGDRESARVAYTMVAQLAPDDARPKQVLPQLTAPVDSPEGRFRAHLAAQRWDAAFVAAAVAHAHPEAAEFYRRYRPRFLQASAPLDPPLLFAQRHPDDDAELVQLLDPLLASQPALALGNLGVSEEEHVPSDFMPSPFRRALRYVAARLGVGEPAVYRRADLGAGVSPGAVAPPILLAGPQALASADLPQLAFRLGRALSFLAGRRAAAAALPAALLDELLSNLPAKHEGARLVRGMHRTADRLGLLLCHDPGVALSLALEPDVLVSFVLSDAHLTLREQLGVSVAV